MSGGEKNENEEDVKKKPTKGEKRRGRSPSKREPIADIEDIMFSIDKVQTMRSSLLDWYDLSHRDLPWRRLDKGQPQTRGYGVWVSEIMLQQTRVQTVVEYYKRWMHKWPTVQHLSRASLEEVNEMWAGLGYYRRARFLLEGAKLIVKEGGEFPKTVSALRKIPGIGEYTAGAIASIAFDEVVPVVDGNVIRVIARLKAISGNPKDSKLVKQVWKAAAQLVDPSRPGDFNQALMELGATLCTPTSPSCSTCPVFDHCEALSISKDDSSVLVTDYPAKGIKTKQRHDYSAVCVVEILENQGSSELKQSSRFLLVKRPDEGLLAGLWEFPSVLLKGEADSSTRRESMNSLLSKSFGLEPKKNFDIVIREDVGDFIHVFSHIRLKIYVEHLVLRLKGEGSKLFRKQEKKSISWKCVDNKVMSSVGLTSSVRKVYAMVEKFGKHYDQPIPIIPLGLNYFNKDHFRSQMTLEFGPPMMITPDMVQSEAFQQDEHSEVKRLTHELEERMHDVTLNASDFSTIHIARMMRRLYLNTPGSIDANKEVRLTQHIINMLEKEPQDDEQKQRIAVCREKVMRYKEQLEKLRLKDQEVNLPVPKEQSLLKLFLERILYLLVLLPLATPGLLLNFPYYFIGTKMNSLAGFVESKSMFKIFAAGVLVPVHWLVLILATWYFLGSSYAYVLAVGLPLLLYSHIRVLEESRSIAENVYFLFNITAHADKVAVLRKERELLAQEVHKLVTAYVDAKFLSAVHKSLASSPVHRTLRHRASSTSDTLLTR